MFLKMLIHKLKLLHTATKFRNSNQAKKKTQAKAELLNQNQPAKVEQQNLHQQVKAEQPTQHQPAKAAQLNLNQALKT